MVRVHLTPSGERANFTGFFTLCGGIEHIVLHVTASCFQPVPEKCPQTLKKWKTKRLIRIFGTIFAIHQSAFIKPVFFLSPLTNEAPKWLSKQH